jgi:hypothetical protein
VVNELADASRSIATKSRLLHHGAFVLAVFSMCFGAAPVRASHDCGSPANVLTNCGFEAGSFANWVMSDIGGAFYSLAVEGAAQTPGFGFFVSAPIEGSQAAVHGFDASSAGTIEMHRDVFVGEGGALRFDYRAGWDLLNYGASDANVASPRERAGRSSASVVVRKRQPQFEGAALIRGLE